MKFLKELHQEAQQYPILYIVDAGLLVLVVLTVLDCIRAGSAI